MRRRNIFVVFVEIILFSFIISFVYAAEIVDVVGKAQVQSSSSTSWHSAKVGMKLAIGDKIRTARRSKVRIALDEAKKNFISVDELTLVVLNSTVPDEINKFDLSEGKLYAMIEKVKAGATFEVTTPSAIAGVRGTAWSVDSKNDRDIVAVYESKVFVQTFDKNKNLISEITVPEGFKTTIERFGPPSELLPLTREERNSWNRVKKWFLGYFQEFKDVSLDKLGNLTDKISDLQDKISDLQDIMEDIQDQIEDYGIDKVIKERIEHIEDSCDEFEDHDYGYEYEPPSGP